MNNRKATKRALLTSVMALAMCVVMLVGTTFAWFTDTAKTNVNKIQAGTLDVALEMKQGDEWVDAEGATLDFKKAAGGADQEILWEPGCTYELPELRVVNNGNLNLKYKVVITGINGDAKLNKAINWTIGNDGTVIEGTDEYVLKAKTEGQESFDTITIKGEMRQDAGNEYQGLSIDGVAVTVYATQMTGEFDSFVNDYDKDATYPTGAMVVGLDGSYETLTAAAKAWRESKGVVTSGDRMGANDIGTVDNVTWLISGEVAVGDGEGVIGSNGAGNSVVGMGYFTPRVTFNNIVIKGVGMDATITDGSVSVGAKNVTFENVTFTDVARIEGDPASLTFKNCTFENGLRIPHSANDAKLVVENCTFTNDGTQDYAIFVQGNNVAAAQFIGNNISGYMRGMNIQLGSNAVVTIENNNIHDLTGKVENGYTYGSAIQLTSAKSFAVKGNTIENVPVNAFHIYNGCTASISFTNNEVSAKYLCWNEANNTNITSSGNTVNVEFENKATSKTEVIDSSFALN